MKRTYIQPTTIVAATRVSMSILAGSDKQPQATYGGGENGDDHSQTGNIGTVGDGDDFTMESKYNAWDEWDD